MQRAPSLELGPYQLVERIGEGGSGQIYRGTGPDGAVAVKILGPAADLDDAARARFGREIAALGQLAHPNLVAMLDHGIDAELGPYLVLPLLAGENLRALCGGRTLCPEAAVLLVQPIVAATAALHAAGFVHRDLKPENAIAAPDGRVTVIDLGLAWRAGMTRHTDTGTAVGSVGYMAPEQIDGRAVDGAADVWALGVMLYEWIAGKRPFQRERPAEEAAAALLGACPKLTAADRRCDASLAGLVARCLALEPAARPSSAELAQQLAAWIDWTETPDVEREAVVADPVAYQARVARFRVGRLERSAREALADGQPFVALAACDRGLAYAPADAGLLALVAEAERSTARKPRKRARWPWFAVGALGIAVGASITYFAIPERTRDPWATPSSSPPAPAQADDHAADKALMHDFASLFGRALDHMDRVPASPTPTLPDGETPTTARGWLELASYQSPADAVASARHALALAPGWTDAEVVLCTALAGSADPGALAACEAALAASPDSVPARAGRAAAHLQAGHARAALADLDRVIAADPDPKWRRVRARAREAAGDHAGARRDLDAACQLGDAAACESK